MFGNMSAANVVNEVNIVLEKITAMEASESKENKIKACKFDDNTPKLECKTAKSR